MLSSDPLRVGVVGVARSGVAAARALLRQGARVFVSEALPRTRVRAAVRQLRAARRPPLRGNLEIECGGHTRRLLACDRIVVSPGVPWDLPILKEARRRGIPVWPEIELGWRLGRPRFTIAVTGTNGKTTTTALLGAMFRAAKRRAIVAGNIGTPLSAVPLAAIRKADTVVLEVSSYQAEALNRAVAPAARRRWRAMPAFRANVAVVLNLTPDHLGRHRTMPRYRDAKARLLELQARGDTAVLNADDARVRAMARRAGGRVVWFSCRRGFPRGFGVERSPLPGPHNRENLLAACAAARAAGLPVAAIRRAVATFRGVPHRLEKVGIRGGVLYVNDSKATNVASTVWGLRSCEQPVVLLLGGRDKGSPYAPLRPLIRERCRAVVLYGEARHLIARTLGGLVRTDIRRTLAEAVTSAAGLAQPNDVVLLSPACASFDQFSDFERRGDAFRALVKRLPR